MDRASSGLFFVLSVLFAMCSSSGESTAQTSPLRVGVLATHGDDLASWFPAVVRELANRGWVDGQNIRLEYKMGHSQLPQIAKGASELAQENVDVIVPVGPPAVHAAYEATRTIPIVAHDLETDPVAGGFAESFDHPGGNLTGFFLDTPELASDWLGLLKAVVPGLSNIVVLVDPSSGPAFLRAIQRVADSSHVELQIIEVRSSEDLDQAATRISTLAQALIVLPSPLMHVQSAKLAKLASEHGLPGVSLFPQFANEGGLFASGPVWTLTYGQLADLLAKVLSGAKPADLPIERPTQFSLIVNRRTADALNLKVPISVLNRATRTIQ